jgi:hypothetical protein
MRIDDVPDIPVQRYQFAVRAQNSAVLRRLYSRLYVRNDCQILIGIQ